MKKKGFKIFMGLLVSLCIIICVYLMIGATGTTIVNAYDNVKPDSTSGLSRTLSFVETYTVCTGDTSLAKSIGLGNEEIEDLVEKGEKLNGENTNDDESDSVDFIEISKKIADSFRDESGNYRYSQSYGNIPVTINGQRVGTEHRDCSCYVSAMMQVIYTGNWVHYISSDLSTNNMGWEEIKVEKFGQLKPGDILVKYKHTAMVVKKDNDYVYTGDCGETEPIARTAENGWAYKYSVDDNIIPWFYASEVKVFRYPNKK